MTDETEYGVLLDFPIVMQTASLGSGQLIIVPIAMNRAGSLKIINPQHAVSLAAYSRA